LIITGRIDFTSKTVELGYTRTAYGGSDKFEGGGQGIEEDGDCDACGRSVKSVLAKNMN
jgi:hypothetical protein